MFGTNMVEIQSSFILGPQALIYVGVPAGSGQYSVLEIRSGRVVIPALIPDELVHE
mgnify:CR=1 FL=1